MNQYSLRYVKYTYQTKYLHDNLYDMLLQYQVISILSKTEINNFPFIYKFDLCRKFLQRDVNILWNRK